MGNCQGGWAAMMLAASHPDDTGPLVINGAPMSYWAGACGEGEGDNPMRYAGAACSAARGSPLPPTWATGSSTAPPGAELREPQPGEHVLGQVLPPVRQRRHRAAALPRVRALVGRLLPDERGRDPLDRRQPVRRQQALVGRTRRAGGKAFDLREIARRSSCSPRWATTSRRRSRRSTGLPTSTEHRGDQGERPGDRRAGARGHRSPRHLRLRQGGEEGARADRLGAEVDRGAAARPVRMEIDEKGRGRQGRVRSAVQRAPARGSRRA